VRQDQEDRTRKHQTKADRAKDGSAGSGRDGPESDHRLLPPFPSGAVVSVG
jgi:hypothetical protein